MVLPPRIVKMLAEQCRQPLSLPAHCSTLALDIESKTGEHVGLNTIKRLLGFISDERQPRATTLNILAQYLGYTDWDALCIADSRMSNSDFNDTRNEMHTSQLTKGDRIEITYLPNRRVVMTFKGSNAFEITLSENSKLCQGDIIHLDHIVKGYPMLVSEVVRNGVSLGAFTAGKAQGVNFNLL